MDEKSPEDVVDPKKRKGVDLETGPYVLRTLLANVPLSAEGDGDDTKINCVEVLGRSYTTCCHVLTNW